MDEDKVELVLAGETILTSKDYDVSIAFLQVPNAFSLTIGSGATAVDLMKRYPERTPFVLRINGVVQFMGLTDGFRRPRGDATEIQIVGRDSLAQLHDDDIEHDRSFQNATFEELARAAFKSAGYSEIDLRYDAAAHRKAVTGTPIVEKSTITKKVLIDLNQVSVIDRSGIADNTDLNYYPFDIQSQDEITTEVQETITKVTGFKAEKPIEWKAGQSHYQALNKELARAGIFLRAGVDPEGRDPNVFLLSEPNAAQAPLFGLARIEGDSPASNVVNVLPIGMERIATGRHARYIVRGRTGSGKDGRQQLEAVFEDAEMTALGYTKRKVVIDENAKTRLQAEFIARRLCAEARRMNRAFTYTIPRRHTLPLFANASSRAIPTPDICVALRDDDNGMQGLYWVERVRFRGSAGGGTFTDLTLMAPEDLVFGTAEFLPAQTRAQRALGNKVA